MKNCGKSPEIMTRIARNPMAASMGITEDKIKLIVAELNKI